VAPKSELVRLAVERRGGAEQPIAVQDTRGTMPGRGVYLCLAGEDARPSGRCLSLAIRRGGIARTLRARVTVDPKIVESVGP
jgi:predicted RNA-binding protein YlxR (DUF448 family)